MKNEEFPYMACAVDGSKHFIGIKESGGVFTWGRSNAMGQLGRRTSSSKPKVQSPQPVRYGQATPTSAVKSDIEISGVKVFAGGSKESGHSAILDSEGKLWMAGCDRWQQLGLGSSEAGASGYTWEQGRIWRDFFTRNDFLPLLMMKRQPIDQSMIRDVALGADHTIVLSSNQQDVYAFGKGGDGQLGLVGKPFVSTPIRSTALSSSSNGPKIAAVCAIHHCSLTLDKNGRIIQKAGKCRRVDDNSDALVACIQKGVKDGLLDTAGK